MGATRACRVRCTEHRGVARNHWDTGVGEHFNLPGHEVADFNFLPFEKIRSSDPFVQEARESFWIEILEPGQQGLLTFIFREPCSLRWHCFEEVRF